MADTLLNCPLLLRFPKKAVDVANQNSKHDAAETNKFQFASPTVLRSFDALVLDGHCTPDEVAILKVGPVSTRPFARACMCV